MAERTVIQRNVSKRPADLGDLASDKIEEWFDLWRVRSVGNIELIINPLLRRSRGRCDVGRSRIEIREDLMLGPRKELLETLCHEAAHIATFQLHGAEARPHGPEWRELMVAAGYEPQTERLAECRVVRGDEQLQSEHPAKERIVFDHLCPVCQTVRTAKRTVRQWRCAECVNAGLEGTMIISRRVERGGRS